MIIDLDWQKVELKDNKTKQPIGVTIELKMLSLDDFQKAASLFNVSGANNLNVKAGTEFLSHPDLKKILSEILTEYAQNINGIQIKEDGNIRDGTVKDLIDNDRLTLIAINVLTELFQISNLSEDRDDLKKQ